MEAASEVVCPRTSRAAAGANAGLDDRDAAGHRDQLGHLPGLHLRDDALAARRVRPHLAGTHSRPSEVLCASLLFRRASFLLLLPPLALKLPRRRRPLRGTGAPRLPSSLRAPGWRW